MMGDSWRKHRQRVEREHRRRLKVQVKGLEEALKRCQKLVRRFRRESLADFRDRSRGGRGLTR